MPFTFERTEIEGFFIIRPHYHEDQRGSSMKLFHKQTFEGKGLKCDFGETLISTNLLKNTIRGFHYQMPPYAQSKLYYCLSGGWDNYSVDIRIGSPTYGKIMKIPMSEGERKVLYIPEGIANAHQVLCDHTKVLYQLTSMYMPEFDSGIRWDSLGIVFTTSNPPIITEKDACLPMAWDVKSPFVYGQNC